MERTISKRLEPPWEPKWQYHLLIFSWLKLKQRRYNWAKRTQKNGYDILTISFPSGTVIKKDVDQFAEEANKFHPTIKFKAEISDNEISSKNQEAHFHGGGSFLRRRLFSTEEALFYGGGSFLRRRLFFYGGSGFLRRKRISTGEVHFYGGSCFLRRKLISTDEDDFCGGDWFPRWRLISSEEADFHWGGQFLSNRLIFVWKTRTIAQDRIVIDNVILTRDKQLWEKITHTDIQCLTDLPPRKRTYQSLRQRGHDYTLPRIRTERFKRCFINRSLFNFI